MCVIYKDLERFDKAELDILLNDREGPAVSLFLPVAAASGRGVQAETLALHNLRNQATAHLTARGLTTAQIVDLLAPVAAMTAANPLLWGDRRRGVAIFVTPSCCLVYRVPVRLPALAVVDQHFYIRPLLPMIDGDESFYILALSQNTVRLFQGAAYQLTAVPLPDTITSLVEALHSDEFERHLQLHTPALAIGHGQGGTEDEAIVRPNRLRGFHAVAQAVTNRLSRTHAPLLLAGSAADQGLYRQVNRYPHMLEQGIVGNYDQAPAQFLHNAAWPIVAPYFLGARNRAIARYHQLAGLGDGHTMTEIKNVVLAAVYHQVDTIFAPADMQIWGRFIPEGHQVVSHKEAEPGDEELVNLAVLYTLKNNGAAYLVGSEAHTVAAILRF